MAALFGSIGWPVGEGLEKRLKVLQGADEQSSSREFTKDEAVIRSPNMGSQSWNILSGHTNYLKDIASFA